MQIQNNIETWRLVDGYDSYEVSSHGRVRNNRTNRILKAGLSGKIGTQYYMVVLCREGERKTMIIHRLVAEAFIDNPNISQFVDHIDNNKLNNNYLNLRWCSRQENNRNKTNHGLYMKGVSFNKGNNKFRTRIKIDGVSYNLGCYDSEDEGAFAYKVASKILFKEFANFDNNITLTKPEMKRIKKKVKAFLRKKELI